MLAHNPLDGLMLDFLEGHFCGPGGPGLGRGCRLTTGRAQLEILGLQLLALGQNNRPLDRMTQRPYIARPGVVDQLVYRCLADAGDGAPIFAGILANECVDQQRDILAAVAQRRQLPSGGLCFPRPATNRSKRDGAGFRSRS